jgi:hypothetical protein
MASNPQFGPPEEDIKGFGPPEDAAPAPVAKGPAPLARTPGNYAREALYGLGRGIKGDVAGLATAVMHPRHTVSDMAEQFRTADQASQKEYDDLKNAYPSRYSIPRNLASMAVFAENAPVFGGLVQHAEQGGTRPFSPEAVGAAAEGTAMIEAPKVAGKAIKGLAPRIVDRLRSQPRTVRDLATKTQTAVDKFEADKADAEHATKGRELSHAQQLQAEASKIRAERVKTNREAAQTHETATADTKATNEAAIREQAKIKPTQEKLQVAHRELQAQIETARNESRKVGNQKYNAVNGALSPFRAGTENILKGLEKARSFIETRSSEPTLLKEIEERMKDEVKPMSYSDDQVFYSRIGNEISKGNLPADQFKALDTMHEIIGEDMQRIADSHGDPIVDMSKVPSTDGVPAYRTISGKALYDARAYWRRMKQAFGKDYSATDAANKALDKTTGIGAEEDQANRVRLLGSFDKSIPQTVEHISNIRKGLDALPTEKPVREVVKPLPAKPTPIPTGNADAVAARSVAPPERVPAPIAPGKIGPEELTKAKAEKVQRAADWVGTKGMAFAVWPVVSILREALRGSMPDMGAAGVEVVGTLAGAKLISKALESPTVVRFLSTATERDIAQIPPDLRGNFPGIVKAAQSKGMRVSSAVAALAVASQPKGPAPRNQSDAWADPVQ